MRRNLHFIIPKQRFRLLIPTDQYLESTTLYKWGTKTAVRRFCKTCGILPFYTPRSNPEDGVAITVGCVVDFEENRPTVVVKVYDGANWEKSHAATGIAKESKLVKPNSVNTTQNTDEGDRK